MDFDAALRGPTRLLDWSRSPYVAAYFAVDQNPDDDGVILVIDRGCVNDHFTRTREAAGGRSFYRERNWGQNALFVVNAISWRHESLL